MLVLWTACCLIHKQATLKHHLLSNYGIALRAADLRVVVTDDKHACDALVHVAAYIRQFERDPTQTVFSLRDNVSSGTICFARSFARRSTEMLSRWNTEMQHAAVRERNHAAEVEKKRQKAAEIRQQIQEKTDTVERYSAEFNSIDHLFHTSRWRSSKQRLRAAQQDLRNTKHHLKTTLKSPAAVINPLPQTEEQALPVVFYLLMPADLERLARFSFRAQEMLVPRPPFQPNCSLDSTLFATKYQRQKSPTGWTGHYNDFSSSSTSASTALEVSFYPVGYHVPPRNTIGPSTIEQISSSSQCVWFPSFDSAIYKSPGHNPFALDASWSQKFFTEALPPTHPHLNWAIAYPSSSNDRRGNLVFAEDYRRPDNFDKRSFIAFGSLRAYPNQQFRKLSNALHERSLPLEDGIVRTLIRQCVFQVGDLSSRGEEADTSSSAGHSASVPILKWRRDLFEHSGLDVLAHDLMALASDLAPAPRMAPSIVVLVELAAFVSQWLSNGRALVRAYVEVAMEWAKDVGNQITLNSERVISGHGDQINSADLRAKQCIMFAYAMFGYSSTRSFDRHDAATLCALVVQVHNGMVFGRESSNAELRQSVLDMCPRCLYVMSGCIDALMPAIIACPGHILTPALQKVFQDAPSDLQWGLVKGTYCFEAATDCDHFMVNLLDGCVLKNATPPGRLPSVVLQDALYQRSFGKRDFEVGIRGDGCTYRTMRAITGRYYEFCVRDCGLVVIREIFAAGGDEEEALELISIDIAGAGADAGTKWSSNVPLRLLELYSHWYSRSRNAVVFRAVPFSDRCVHYIMMCENGPCFEIPLHECHHPLKYLYPRRKQFDELVQVPTCILEVLEKMENRSFIHALRCELGSVLRVHMPRLALTFTMKIVKKGSKPSCIRFHSEEHRGYHLADHQQLESFVPHFTHYLVLHRDDQYDTSIAYTKIIVPAIAGAVIRRHDPADHVRVELSTKSNAVIDSFVYEWHDRMQVWKAKSIVSRLHLAAILAASSTPVPDLTLKMTGAEAAIILLRQCWTNRPLDATERACLANIGKFSDCVSALLLMCEHIHCSSERFRFLHCYSSSPSSSGGGCTNQQALRDAQAHYVQRMRDKVPDNDARRLLTPIEAAMRTYCHRTPYSFFRRYYLDVNHASGSAGMSELLRIHGGMVTTIETRLQALTRTAAGTQAAPALSVPPVFPLQSEANNELALAMMAELEDSWKQHHQSKVWRTASKQAVDSAFYLENEVVVHNVRKEVEVMINASLESRSTRAKLLHHANRLPTATVSDLVHMLLDDGVISRFNPFLDQSQRTQLQALIRMYMELCVLEDKLQRLICICRRQQADNADASLLLQELRCAREWSTAEHPRWLAFEFEQGLQIRPHQYAMARHLLDTPGTISQLNMGLGKTRVILPMLIMSWTSGHYRHPPDGNHNLAVLRLHFLQSLISEAFEFLHCSMTATAANVRFCLQPFHRDVNINLDQVALLHEQWNSAVVQVIAVEHRLSLQLKWHELRHNLRRQDKEIDDRQRKKLNVVADELSELLAIAQDDAINVFDESDAILNHKYQLIYAIGAPGVLPDARIRAVAIQALLRVLNDPSNAAIAGILSEPDVAMIESADPGTYRRIRLMPTRRNINHEDDDDVRQRLRLALIDAVMDNPPYEMMWLSEANESILNRIREGVTCSSRRLSSIISKGDLELLKHWHQVLALRGLLALGVFEHCMERRHRVDYGVHQRTRVAVPFRAADVPSERSEFSHPDVCLMLTCLSYYHTGLSHSQVRQAVRELIALSPSAAEHHYMLWFEQVCGHLSVEQKTSIDDVRKLDLSSEVQRRILYSAYRMCTETINFWLNAVVVDNDTTQYPAKLVQSAWHLPGGHNAVGFSGTNDTHRLLPLLVNQIEPEIRSLQGTNGRMLQLLLENAVVKTLPDIKDGIPQWMCVLEYVISHRLDALIDTGSLLAGVTNEDAARYLLQHDGFATSKFRGILYYLERDGHWMVLERSTRRSVPRHRSPVRDSEAFVLFDDARTRGSDMKLAQSAVAALTLGPGLLKDKLMQGAGRLRKFGYGQTLHILCPCELQSYIAAGGDDGSRVEDVLQWIMANTSAANSNGLSEWAKQGLYYSETLANPEAAVLEENWGLEELYDGEYARKPLSEVVEVQANAVATSCGTGSAELCRDIRKQGRKFGADIWVVASQRGEECERQIQQEEEEEEEVVLQRRLLVYQTACRPQHQHLMAAMLHEHPLVGFISSRIHRYHTLQQYTLVFIHYFLERRHLIAAMNIRR